MRVEDARQRKWFGARSSSKLQGAGSVKRDSAIWDDYLKSTGVMYRMVSPANNTTKWMQLHLGGTLVILVQQTSITEMQLCLCLAHNEELTTIR